ncbi:uncharacterized protein ACRADG_012831 [Cochliomyia hominivorax]
MIKIPCTTTAITENEIRQGPLLFSHLEVLANSLIQETLNLHQEFINKSQFVNEEFIKTYKNEQQLQDIFYMFIILQQQFSKVEEEINLLECEMTQFKNLIQHFEIINKMEQFCLKNISCNCRICCWCRCKTDRQLFLKLLQETNRKLEGIPDCLEKMLELRNYAKLKGPYSDILAVINFHCDILKNCDKNMDLLMDKLSFIEVWFATMKRPINKFISKL